MAVKESKNLHDVVKACERLRILRDVVKTCERLHILSVLDDCRQDKRKAARILGVGLSTLYRKLAEARRKESR